MCFTSISSSYSMLYGTPSKVFWSILRNSRTFLLYWQNVRTKKCSLLSSSVIDLAVLSSDPPAKKCSVQKETINSEGEAGIVKVWSPSVDWRSDMMLVYQVGLPEWQSLCHFHWLHCTAFHLCTNKHRSPPKAGFSALPANEHVSIDSESDADESLNRLYSCP